MNVNISPTTTADVEVCGRIIYQAFKGIADYHRFPPDYLRVESAIQLVRYFVNHPSILGLVAKSGGQVIGTSFLDERNPIRGVGPVAADPHFQGRGIGRHLMEALLKKARGSAGIRLTQNTFNMLSMSLYISLGFEVKDHLVLISGKPKSMPVTEVEVRPLKSEDLNGSALLCTNVCGFERTNELKDALKLFSPFVALREGRITAYTYTYRTTWTLAHGVAETEEDMEALILGIGALSAKPLSFLLPVRQAGFFRWCLNEGLRIIKPVTLMVIGKYQEPRGCYLPSEFY